MTLKRFAEFLRSMGTPYLGRDGKNDTATPYYLNALAGKRIAMEMACIIYKQNAGAVSQAINNHTFIYDDVHGWSEPAESDILAIYRNFFRSYMRKVVESGVQPVAILEGKGPALKAETLKKRQDTKSGNERKADDMKRTHDLDAFKKHLKSSFYPRSKHMEIAADVLRELRIPTLRACHEAEGVCAYLVNHKEDPYACVCAITDDYDIFMYGCRAVLRNLRTAPAKMGSFEGTAYAVLDILTALRFIRMEEVDGVEVPDMKDYGRAIRRLRLFCILCGTDYHPNIYNVGCKKVWDIMQTATVTTCKVAMCTIQHGKYRYDEYKDLMPDGADVTREWEAEVYREDLPDGVTPLSVDTHRIETYADICHIDPRFREIPYDAILGVLRENLRYNVLYDPTA